MTIKQLPAPSVFYSASLQISTQAEVVAVGMRTAHSPVYCSGSDVSEGFLSEVLGKKWSQPG